MGNNLLFGKVAVGDWVAELRRGRPLNVELQQRRNMLSFVKNKQDATK